MKLVIVGGGFAGVRLALALANNSGFDIKLISSQSYFEYHAALYRSATGRSPLEVAIPLKDFFKYAKNIEVVKDEIAGLDAKDKTITGKSGSNWSYDRLVLALGNVTQYFGIKGLKEYSYGVKTVHEALELKRNLHEDILNNRSDLNYVVVGAGATGVELSAELVAYLRSTRRKHNVNRAFSVKLIEAGPHVLPSLPRDFSKPIQKRLTKLGVKLYTDSPVQSETADDITIPNGNIKTHTVVWTAGVANNPFFARYPKVFKVGKMGRVVVDRYMQAAPDIFVVGDSADTQYSGMAQTALHDAAFLAKNLKRLSRGQPMTPYKPQRPIYAIPVGPNWTAVLWGKTKIYGWFGWVLRRLADLRLYLTFLPLNKALTTWRYGMVLEETCPICDKRQLRTQRA